MKKISRKKIVKISAAVFSGIVILAAAGIIVPSVAVSEKLMHPGRRLPKFYPEGVSLPCLDVEFSPNEGKIILKGWFIPAEEYSDRWIILSHGYRSNRNIWYSDPGFLDFIQEMHKRNLNIFTFDFRCCGLSGGDTATVGYFEREDLKAAFRFLKRTYPEARIGLIGWSQGAAVTILAASDPGINPEWIIADSPFADLPEYLKSNLPYWSGLPHFPYTPVILKYIDKTAGIDVTGVSPVKAAGSVSCSVLLIHCLGDKAIPSADSVSIYDRWKGSIDIRIELLPDSSHIHGFIDHRERYLSILDSFFSANGF